MAVETDKNRRLTDEMNQLQRRLNGVESELMGLKQIGDGKIDFQHLQREMDKLIRENEDHKHRYTRPIIVLKINLLSLYQQVCRFCISRLDIGHPQSI